jgi:hypothetical protein
MSSQSYIFNPTERTLAASGDGFSLPRLTTAGRLALVLGPGDRGMMVYDTSLSTPYWWTGVAWATFSGGTAYSQGTWLAQLICPIGTITEDPAVKTGYWSQIGSTVSISMKLRVQSVAGPSGQLEMITLPFPAIQETAVTVTADLMLNGAKTTLMGYVSGFSIFLTHYESGLQMDLAQHVPAGGTFWVSGTYITP